MKFFNYRDFILNEDSNLQKNYSLDLNWWAVWKKENESKYDIKLNAVTKSYEVKDKDNDTIFIYDYSRQKVFTNERPSFFDIKDEEISPKELDDVTNKEEKTISPPTPEVKDDKKKETDSVTGLEKEEE